MPATLPNEIPHGADSKAYVLHRAVAEAKRAAQPGESRGLVLEVALANRQDFWLETCRDPLKKLAGSHEVLELYRQYGCVFDTPTREQVQEILDALDVAMPQWDLERPDLFFQTLELNFKELHRVR
jgi:hypothetical protein